MIIFNFGFSQTNLTISSAGLWPSPCLEGHLQFTLNQAFGVQQWFTVLIPKK